MPLRIESLKLDNFRNHGFLEISGFGPINVFVGENGVGKTNIVESIQLLTSLESFKNPKKEELVRWGEEKARASASLKGEGRDLTICLSIERKSSSFSINGKRRKKKELMGILPSVMFSPDDLVIVKNCAEKRRNALDGIGGRISSTYKDLRSNYLKSLHQKNILLGFGSADAGLIDIWNENLSALGSSLVEHRLNLFSMMRAEMISVFEKLGQGLSFDVSYIPSWDIDNNEIRREIPGKEDIVRKISEKLRAMRDIEIEARKTLAGPQRDDLAFYIEGKDARSFASQGQQRMVALSWKIAEMRVLEKITGSTPILILDDVFSEFDRKRKGFLVEFLEEVNQTFITTTDVGNIGETLAGRAKVYEI